MTYRTPDALLELERLVRAEAMVASAREDARQAGRLERCLAKIHEARAELHRDPEPLVARA